MQDDELPDDLLDFTAAARLLKCNLATLHRWRFKGRLRAWKRGGRYFASKAECLALFKPVEHEPTIRAPRPAPKREARELERQRRWTEDVLRRAGIIRGNETGGTAS